MTKRKKLAKQVSYRDGTLNKEDLPMPFVYYPGHYGTFFAFRESEGKSLFFCECFRSAIKNSLVLDIKWHDSVKEGYQWDDIKDYRKLVVRGNFPKALYDEELTHKHSVEDMDSLLSHFKFEPNLCHECNKKTPDLAYCVPMYGGVFKQSFGWYINKQSYEFGIPKLGFQFFLKELCPDELKELLNDELFDLPKRYQALYETDYEQAKNILKSYRKHENQILKFIENQVRIKLGYPKVGESWISETALYYLVKELYPDLTIIRHYRPSFLGGLELDLFVKEFNLGIEYQGIQHFQPIKHWGGEEALAELKKRDKAKKRKCEKEGVNLIYFYHDEDLTKNLIKVRLPELSKSK